VVGVEHINELASWSLSNLQNMPASSGMGALLASQAVQVHVGDGRLGWAAEAPYTCIHVGAAAPTLPAALVEQLAPGGRMVIPVGEEDQELLLVDKDEMGRLTQQRVMGVRFVPLCSKGEQVGGK
jgi:protein-L-isoaspartate(D-aspartate) O-methyltransferase